MFTLMTVPEYSRCTTSFYIIPTNCLHFESQNMKLYSHEILAFCEFWLTWVQTSNVYCRNMRQFVCSASDRRPPLAATTHNLPVTTVQRWVAVSLCSALAEPDCIWWVMLPRTKRGRGWGLWGLLEYWFVGGLHLLGIGLHSLWWVWEKQWTIRGETGAVKRMK